MKWPILLVIGIIAGVLFTFLTGFINTTPNVVGAVWYGFPFAWLIKMVVAPQYYPWSVRYLQLIADFVVWTLVAWAIIFATVYCARLAKKTPSKNRTRR